MASHKTSWQSWKTHSRFGLKVGLKFELSFRYSPSYFKIWDYA